jgi:hypothetical protein
MHKNATKCNKILSKWCKNKHGASKIIDTFGTYHTPSKNMTVAATYTGFFWSQTGFFWPRPDFSGQKSGTPYWQVAPLKSARGSAFFGPGPAFSGPPKLAEIPKQKGNNLSIRTPFFMILGSLESQQRALQLYVEKHHSPNKEDKTK